MLFVTHKYNASDLALGIGVFFDAIESKWTLYDEGGGAQAFPNGESFNVMVINPTPP